MKPKTTLSNPATDSKPMYENAMCKKVGLMATCNSCDRIIYEDENWLSGYINSGGYCKGCWEVINESEKSI